MVRFLVEEGKADVTLRDSDGEIAADLALHEGHSDVVQYLKPLTELALAKSYEAAARK
jgi:hypothetical protein